jgi:DNA recombination protein RmuC
MTELVLATLGAGALMGAALVLLLPGRVAGAVRGALGDRLAGLDSGQERIDRAVREELGKNRDESSAAAARLRDELRGAHRDAAEATTRGLALFGDRLEALEKRLDARLSGLTDANEKRLDGLRATVDERLKALQEDNGKRLEEMRRTVDEKLQGTLEKRLNDSFKLVSERLRARSRSGSTTRSSSCRSGSRRCSAASARCRRSLRASATSRRC